MSLPVPTMPRRRVHTRNILIEGHLRDDDLLELEASLSDVKDQDYRIAPGVRPGGEPLHLMRVRITFDRAFNIVDVHASSDAVPYVGQCESIAPAYRQLIGLNLLRGFRTSVGEMFADVRGCTHMSELLLSLPTAAIQTFATFWRDTDDTPEKPFHLDGCHALDTSGETVRSYFPKWYRQPGRDA
jgi:hypothetical protein